MQQVLEFIGHFSCLSTVIKLAIMIAKLDRSAIYMMLMCPCLSTDSSLAIELHNFKTGS